MEVKETKPAKIIPNDAEKEAAYRAQFERDRVDIDRAFQSAAQSFGEFNEPTLIGYMMAYRQENKFFDPRVVDALAQEMEKREMKDAKGFRAYLESVDYTRPWLK